MSDEADKEQNKAVKDESVDSDPSVGAPVHEINPEKSAEEKLVEIEKDYLYLRAELENIKRQNIKERSQLLKFGGERLARDLLDTLDVFNSALKNEINPENIKDFVAGIEITAQSLKTVLEKHGVVEMDCVGAAFDPNTQEAISSELSNDYAEGFVTQVFKAPYKYHDKLLRAGQVIVSRGKTQVT